MDYLRGEVQLDSQVVLTTWIQKTAYFLTYSATDQELVFITNPTDNNMVVATMENFGSGAVSFQIDNPTNLNSWIGATNVSGRYWATLTNKEGLSFTNNQFQPWEFPLTGVNYAFQQAGFTVNWRIMLEDSSGMTTDSRIESGIRVVPLELYPMGKCTETTLTIDETISNEQKAAAGTDIPNYFTTLGDCNDNLFYQYCDTGTQCGPNCKSPCSLATDVCTLDKLNMTYGCVNPNPGSGGLSPVFIAVIILAVLVVLMVIFFGLWQPEMSYYNF